MNARRLIRNAWRPTAVALAAAALAALPGCLDEPEIDERWTLLEMLDSQPVSQAQIDPSGNVPVTVQGRITYRAIHTGYLVAELRYSPTLTPTDFDLDPSTHDLEQARQVDMVLENSVTAGRATKAVTGFDHLMQDIHLTFDGRVPAAMTSGGTLNGGLFLLLYLADGEEIELGGGRDTLVVTPKLSRDFEILGTGLELRVASPVVPVP